MQYIRPIDSKLSESSRHETVRCIILILIIQFIWPFACNAWAEEANPGEEKKVTFTLTPQQLSLVAGNGRRWAMPGQIKLHVGGNQHQGLEALLALAGNKTQPVYRFVPPVIQ